MNNSIQIKTNQQLDLIKYDLEQPKQIQKPQKQLSYLQYFLIFILIFTTIYLFGRFIQVLLKAQQKNQEIKSIYQVKDMPIKHLDMQYSNNLILNIKISNQQEISKHCNPAKSNSLNLYTIMQNKYYQITNKDKSVKKKKQIYWKEFMKQYCQKTVFDIDENFQNTGITYSQMAESYQYRKLIDQPNNQQLIKKQYEYYQQKYNIDKYEQLPFCISISSYNNIAQDRYKRNLISILQQNYTNYHVVYTNDKSTDGTLQAVKAFLSDHPLKSKVTIVNNEKNQKMLLNSLNAAKNYCKPNQIFFRVDGDDQIIGKQVLKLFNSIYQSNDVWTVYSNSIDTKLKIYYMAKQYSSNIIENNDYRYGPYSYFHQHSHYTKLLLKIKDKDFRDLNGKYFQVSEDVPMDFPILQMSHKKVFYIPQITYYYNIKTGLNDGVIHQSKQLFNFIIVANFQKYQPINQTLF